MTTHVVVHRSSDVLAAAAAARLITAIVTLQATGKIPGIALTGGGVGTSTLTALAASPAKDAVDWARVDFFWGDERFVPADDAERNEKQAREALLDSLPIDPHRVHPIAASDGPYGDDPDAAARAYGQLLADRPDPLDIVLLGMGGEGHVASIFPQSAAVGSHAAVVPVRNCPKPPPTRISLTLPTIRRAAQVWLLVAGSAKAAAVADALGGADETEIPAAGARGADETWWMLDTAAAQTLPPQPPAR